MNSVWETEVSGSRQLLLSAGRSLSHLTRSRVDIVIFHIRRRGEQQSAEVVGNVSQATNVKQCPENTQDSEGSF